MKEKREFIVETPLGKLKVYAKHESDNPADFPGVFVDLVREGEDDEMLACVEYDSCSDTLQTCVYDVGCAAPEVIHTHKGTEKKPNKVRFGVSWMCYAKQEIELPDDIDPDDEDAVRGYIESVWEDVPLPGNSDAYVSGSDSLDVDAPFEIVKG